MNAWVGIDVSKATLDVVLLRQHDQVPMQVSNDRAGWRSLHHFLQKRCRQGAHVCLEATGLYGDGVAEFLHAHGYVVSVVNPLRIKAYAASQMQRNKTDRADARVIADFCRTQQPEPWQPPAPELQELRALLRHLTDLQTMRQQEHNRLQAGEPSAAVRASLQQHLTFLDQQLTQVRQQIDDHFNQHPDLKQQRDLLTSIPGIGDLTAGRLLAELRDIRAFASAKQLAAFVGVTPRRHQSGTAIHRPTHISKQGSARLRAALYFPAIVARRHNPLLRPFADRLAAAGKSKACIVLAVMRKLLHLVYGILKSGQPFDPHYLDHLAAVA